jgi:hypothetical protein
MDRPFDRDHRLPRELGKEREERGVGHSLLQRDLGRPRAVPDERERDAPEGAVVLYVSGDPDNLAVELFELTREPA